MSKIERIKAEIERLKESLPWGSCASQISMECNCKNEAYNEMLKFIDSFEEEPISNDLEEAAKTYEEDAVFYAARRISDFFKAGAQWQKKQTIDKACEWLRTHSEADYFELIPFNYCGAGNLNKKKMIKDFKKYMEE